MGRTSNMEQTLGFVTIRTLAFSASCCSLRLRCPGNLTSATVFGKRFVFIHSYELALEIFEKNGNIFSDRPRLQMMRMMGWEVTPMLMQPGASFKESRKMMYTEFGTNSVVHKLSIYEEESAKRLVKMLISSPDEFYKHVEL